MHTTLTHTIFYIHTCTTLSHTQNKRHTTLSHTIFHSRAIFHACNFVTYNLSLTRRHTHTRNFVTDNLLHTHTQLAWQAWRLGTLTFLLHGMSGMWGAGLVALGPCWSPKTLRHSFCVAGVAGVALIHWAGSAGALGGCWALGVPFAWQAWHLWRWAGSGGAT